MDPDFKRMKEEHLVKMASLRQEAELLKQQAEVEKMRKELKELRGESLPLQESRKVRTLEIPSYTSLFSSRSALNQIGAAKLHVQQL